VQASAEEWAEGPLQLQQMPSCLLQVQLQEQAQLQLILLLCEVV
jgi:hypothetical protein